jgi:hypothetical protein
MGPTAGGKEPEIVADQAADRPALSAGPQALRVPLDENGRIAGVDCGLRRRLRRVTGTHPLMVIHSQKDYRLDVSEGFQLFTALQPRGVPSKTLYFPGEGHCILKPQNSEFWYKTVNDWVDPWIGKP